MFGCWAEKDLDFHSFLDDNFEHLLQSLEMLKQSISFTYTPHTHYPYPPIPFGMFASPNARACRRRNT